MKILALSKFSNGTLALPLEVREKLGITEKKGKVVFYETEQGEILLKKA